MAHTLRRTDRYLQARELPDRDHPLHASLAALLHSDKPGFYNGPPKQFRRPFDRSLRQKAERILKRSLREPHHQALVDVKHRQSAAMACGDTTGPDR